MTLIKIGVFAYIYNMKQLIIILFLLVNGHFAFAQDNSFYSLSALTIDGEEFPFDQLRGKKVMIVNTATKCSLSPQFKTLQKLFNDYGDKNFIVLGFPSNDFAKREPGSNKEIKSTVERRFGVTFPMMQKISINGENIHPVYQWLTQKELNGIMDSEIKWNFQKYLVDEKGILFDIIDPIKKPDGGKVIGWIERLPD